MMYIYIYKLFQHRCYLNNLQEDILQSMILQTQARGVYYFCCILFHRFYSCCGILASWWVDGLGVVARFSWRGQHRCNDEVDLKFNPCKSISIFAPEFVDHHHETTTDERNAVSEFESLKLVVYTV